MKEKLIWMLLLVLAMGVLAGCSAGSSGPTNEEEVARLNKTLPPSDPNPPAPPTREDGKGGGPGGKGP